MFAFTRNIEESEMLLFVPPCRALIMPCLLRLHGSVPGAYDGDDDYDTFYEDAV